MKDVPKCLQCCQRLIALSRFSKKALRNDFVIHCQHRLNDAIVLASFFITRMAIILSLNKSFPKRSIVVCLHGCNIAVFFEKFITEAIFENSHYPNRFWRFEGDHVKSALCEGWCSYITARRCSTNRCLVFGQSAHVHLGAFITRYGVQ